MIFVGELQVLPVKHHASVCTGGSVSLELAITNAFGQPTVQWKHEGNFLDFSEHYSLNEGKTVLEIDNALPPHSGNYEATVTDGISSKQAIFNVDVHGKNI